MTFDAPRAPRDRRYSSNLWRSVREQTYRRDDRTCQGCGRQERPGDRALLVADHKTPPHRGGDFYALSNTQTLCRSCNYSKGIQTDEEWRARSRPTDIRQPLAPVSKFPTRTPLLARPVTPPTFRNERRIMELEPVPAEPADHGHGRWSTAFVYVVKGGPWWSCCPDSCTHAPVRWPRTSLCN
jgi:hypothetical protein